MNELCGILREELEDDIWRPYLDNIRSLVIFLVVAMHSNVTYSGMGRRYRGWS